MPEMLPTKLPMKLLEISLVIFKLLIIVNHLLITLLQHVKHLFQLIIQIIIIVSMNVFKIMLLLKQVKDVLNVIVNMF